MIFDVRVLRAYGMAVSIEYGHPEVTKLDGFNRLAIQRGWKVRCDGGGQYYQPEMAQVHALWCAQAGASPPPRRAMTARLLKPYLQLLVIHERVRGSDGTRCYRVRLMGSAPAEDIGDGSRKLYDDFLPPSAVPVWNAMGDAVLGHGGPVRTIACADHDGKDTLVGELFAAPLLTDEGCADLILSAGRFNSLWSWDELLAHWEQDTGV